MQCQIRVKRRSVRRADATLGRGIERFLGNDQPYPSSFDSYGGGRGSRADDWTGIRRRSLLSALSWAHGARGDPVVAVWRDAIAILEQIDDARLEPVRIVRLVAE